MKTKEYISKSVEETIKYGKQFAESLHPGDVICLFGDLGAGKTHFVKGIASFFGIDEGIVNSPTFVIIQEYSGTLPIYHFDAYRIKSEQEALRLGVEEYFFGDGISVIEWPQNFGTLIPEDAIDVFITAPEEGKRLIRIVQK